MNKHPRRNLIPLVLLAVLISALSVFFLVTNTQDKDGQSAYEPYRTNLTGEYICLPRVSDKTQTDECVPGLLVVTGEYYGIDFHLMSQEHKPVAIGSKIVANGVVVPVQRLSTDQWDTYPILGIFSVTDSLEVIE